MTLIGDSRKPDHVENVYIPMNKDGVFLPELAVRGFKAPKDEMDFKYLLEWELLELAKKEKITAGQLQILISRVLKQNSSLTEKTIDNLIYELIRKPGMLSKLKQLKFPSDRQSHYLEKAKAKKYLEEERTLRGLLEQVL
tara:strand:- start:39 stop:458 length:420 start_codon:yes stop_codon:yes gene_type:complete